MSTQLIPEMWFDLQEPDLSRDPYALLREMRQSAPVYYCPELASWMITRYDDVGFALRDPRFHAVEENKKIDALPRATRRELDPMRRIFTQWGGRDDPPAHEEFLRVMKKHFTPRRMLAQLPVIEAIMDRLPGAAVAPRGPGRVVSDP